MGPYDSLRDYLTDLEKRGRFIRIKEMDQDKYEATAFVLRMMDRLRNRAPGFMIERVKQNGRWYDTKVVGNIYNGYDTLAMCLGVDPVTDDNSEMYYKCVEKIESFADAQMNWKKIEPKTVDKAKAPCKEVIIKGDKVDLFQFPWIKNGPEDAGAYISAGCFILEDPDIGRNVGTYRMQVKDKNKTGANFTMNSHAYQFMLKASERGKESVPAAVAIGIDPASWMMSSTRLAELGDDEFALAGGFRGKPVELVKCETCDIMVPAQAEFILEGEVPVDVEPEGPYGEMLGFLGLPGATFYLKVKTITHRKDPLLYNIWCGMERSTYTLPWDAANFMRMKKVMPTIVKLYTPIECPLITIVSIDKHLPGEGMEAGAAVLGQRMIGFTKKIVIIVDKDVDPFDLPQVMNALGTRWQPVPGTLLIPQMVSMPLDPSQKEKFLTSKVIIDATRQLPSEGGPESWVPTNRCLMDEKAGDAFKLVDSKWEEYFKKK